MKFEVGKQQLLHNQVWTRFIHKPYGYILDYADKNGETTIPTPEECNESMPNVLGWWTPIENGAFFTGLYLYAMVEECEQHPTDQLKKEIDILTRGLFHLQDVGVQDGFIARGVASDGVSHYPFGSEDQFGPWIVGLWRLWRSPLVTDIAKDELKDRMLRALYGARKAGWDIPTDVEGVTRGSYIHDDWRGVSKRLFCCRVAYALSSDEKDLLLYQHDCTEHPDGSIFNRLQIASHGFAPDMVRTTHLIQFWIDICAHLSLNELSMMDEENRDYFIKGMNHNAVTVLPFVDDYTKYDNQNTDEFSFDWRQLRAEWQPFTKDCADEAVKNALRMGKIWGRTIVPRRHMEHNILGNCLFAAWIAITTPCREVAEYTAQAICKCVTEVDWTTMHLSYAFAAESVYFTARNLLD